MKIDATDDDAGFSSDLLVWNSTGNPSPDQLFDGFQHLAFKSEESAWSTLLNLDDARNSDQVSAGLRVSPHS